MTVITRRWPAAVPGANKEVRDADEIIGMGKKKTPANQTKPSYRDLDPLEQGGPIARRGFAYQDHVAAGKCLDMLLDGGPSEVWCEAEDDIVLVWLIQTEECFEFVQVKSNELDQLWSLAKLCEKEPGKDGKGPGACIVEKSLAHDRGDGKCRFRIVTCREPNSDLAVLKLDLDHPARAKADSGITEVVQTVQGRVGAFTSGNGNGVEFWVQRTVWECKATINDLKNENLVKLDKIIFQESGHLAPDQKEELYAKLLRKVYDASLACGKTQKPLKRITKDALRTWLLQQMTELAKPASAGRSDVLENKLKEGGLGGDEIEAAKEQRRTYRQSVLQQKFLDLDDRRAVEAEVQARLMRLKAQLDAGEVDESGVQFHCRCLKELEALRDSLTTKQKPLVGLLYGLMYDIMNRCQHRLVKASA